MRRFVSGTYILRCATKMCPSAKGEKVRGAEAGRERLETEAEVAGGQARQGDLSRLAGAGTGFARLTLAVRRSAKSATAAQMGAREPEGVMCAALWRGWTMESASA